VSRPPNDSDEASEPLKVMEVIEVVEDERIAPHGQVHVWWFVQKADDYVKAGEWPGAVTERRDSGPGTVWERVIRLVLPQDTELMRVEVRPRPPVRRDPLSYLEREQKAAPSATRRSYFLVTRGGLRPIPGRG
jgi:hypothetical protein